MPEFKVGDRVIYNEDGHKGKIVEIFEESQQWARIELTDGIFVTVRMMKIDALNDVPAFEIEPGKFYRLRNGGKYHCLSITSMKEGLPIVGELLTDEGWLWVTHGVDGRSAVYEEYDIVAPWRSTPVVNWKAMPEWIEGVFSNTDGAWLGYYDGKPRMDEHCWGYSNCKYTVIPPAYFPTDESGKPWEGGWKDSLCERQED